MCGWQLPPAPTQQGGAVCPYFYKKKYFNLGDKLSSLPACNAPQLKKKKIRRG